MISTASAWPVRARRHLLVARRVDASAGIAGDDLLHAVHVLEDSLHRPKSSRRREWQSRSPRRRPASSAAGGGSVTASLAFAGTCSASRLASAISDCGRYEKPAADQGWIFWTSLEISDQPEMISLPQIMCSDHARLGNSLFAHSLEHEVIRTLGHLSFGENLDGRRPRRPAYFLACAGSSGPVKATPACLPRCQRSFDRHDRVRRHEQQAELLRKRKSVAEDEARAALADVADRAVDRRPVGEDDPRRLQRALAVGAAIVGAAVAAAGPLRRGEPSIDMRAWRCPPRWATGQSG